ncbi:MAG TPA: GNAT family N-acetyltransferase [Microcella sp.]|nr:GNAT family N-acetyltransferase [Microcella sp.]
MSDTQILRQDDPRVSELLAQGYRLVGESWGANLHLPTTPDLSSYAARVDAIRARGIELRELDVAFADALYDLEVANNADYPFTPATHQALPTRASIRALWRDGKRVFGAIDDGMLVGAIVWTTAGDRVDNDFASVRASHRGSGVASAIAALSIVTLAEDGARHITAGGAAVNAASLALVRASGFEVDELWGSYARE